MSALANPLRGETSFRIAGQDHVLRPTFENLVAAEAEIGSLFALVERASQGALTLSEITSLVWHCLPQDHRPERKIVGAAILAFGLAKAMGPVRAILAQALQGEL